MDSALIVSGTEKIVAYCTDMLHAASYGNIVVLRTGGEARRLVMERAFDVAIINAPLPDESGEGLSRHLAHGGGQVILIVKNEFFDAVSAVTEDDGVLVVAKPMNRTILWSALKMARSVGKKLARVQMENDKLKQRIADIRVVDRAKCVLIAVFSMSEQEAHRYIEKQAMDMRQTKRVIAEGILKTYEN